MSQPQPNKNAALMQFLLMACTIFLGIQLFTGGMSQKPETRSLSQIRENLMELSKAGKDITIQQEVRIYDTKLNEEFNAKRISVEERDQKSIEAHIWSAQTSLRAGAWKSDIGRVNTAYTQLDQLRTKHGNSPLWQEEFSVFPLKGTLENTTFSGAQLYEFSRERLSALNKSDRIIGFIPGYDLIDSLVALTGRQPWISYTFAAFLLALIVRIIVWPLSQKQLKFGRQMQQLQPLMKELKEKHTKNGVLNQIEYQQDTMKLYSEYGINPVKGCLPGLAQMPFFLLIFQCMMHYRFEFEKGLFMWINPASHATNSFFAPNLGKMDYTLLGVYAVSMAASTLMQPVSDPSMVKQQRIMGVVVALLVTVSMFFFPLPSAFVLYWIFLNVFSTLQALRAYKMPMPALQKVKTAHGGVKPKSGFFEKLMEQQQAILDQKREAEKAAEDGKAETNGKLSKPRVTPTQKK